MTVYTDITDIKRQEGLLRARSAELSVQVLAHAERLSAAKRELAAQLTSGLAHDFANLLTIIMGLQGRIERTEGLPPVAADLARATRRCAAGRHAPQPHRCHLRPARGATEPGGYNSPA